jgi:hypothetical protein
LHCLVHLHETNCDFDRAAAQNPEPRVWLEREQNFWYLVLEISLRWEEKDLIKWIVEAQDVHEIRETC